MSDHDDLRVRLARLDPASTSDPVESPRAQELLERIMATPVLTEPSDKKAGPRRRAVIAWAAAAAAVVAIGSVAAGVALHDDKPGPTAAAINLDLTLPSSAVMSSCLRFDVQILKGMSPAFAGTVTTADTTHVVLDVDHWYAGGPADTVTLAVPDAQSSASLDGVAFEQGKRYLVTAAEGNVNGCGYSGLATPDLEASFAEAFGG